MSFVLQKIKNIYWRQRRQIHDRFIFYIYFYISLRDFMKMCHEFDAGDANKFFPIKSC